MTDKKYERLTGADLTFLAMEDGKVHMHIGFVSIFEADELRVDDGGLDIERIEAYIESGLHKVPRLRQKLAWVPGIGQPVWVDDPHFNLHYHVRHTALPAPGDIRQLKRLAGRITSQELDRGKPLWEHWFVDGLEGDRFALISKIHHCMVDGVSGFEVLGLIVNPDPDFEPEPPPKWRPRPEPGGTKLLIDEVRHRTNAQIELIGSQLRRSDSGSSGGLPSLRDLRELAAAGASGVSPTPLNVPIGPHRRIDWARMPFEEVHELGRLAGGKINDVVLAVTSGAMRGFLGGRGVDMDELDLRINMPVDVRDASDRTDMGNRVSGLIVPLPTAEADPWARLQQIIETTEELKASGQSQAAESMTQMVDFMIPSLLGPFFRMGSQTTPANFAVSNVRGPLMPLYLLGARQLEAYGAVPLIGNQALGVALMSFDDSLFWCFNADWDVLPDLHDLVEHIEASYEELKQSVPKKLRPKGKRKSRS